MKKIFIILEIILLLLFCSQAFAAGVDSYTKLMLHADRTGTSFEDSSPSGRAVTVSGNATQSASQYKFGAKSAYFDGNGDYLTVADNNDWDLGGVNFTIDLWVRTTTTTNYTPLILRQNGIWAVGHYNILLNNGDGGGKVAFWLGDYSLSAQMLLSTTSVNDGIWHHIAVVRSGSSWKLFIDGIIESSYSGSVTVTDITAPITIGNDNIYSGRGFAGYIDEVRFSKGIARWTSNFVPPDVAYTQAVENGVNSRTKLMLHLNESNASFRDSSPMQNTVTNSSLGYTASGKFSGAGVFTGGYLSVPYNSALNPGTGDFCIDAQIKMSSLNSYSTLIGQNTTGPMIVHLYSTGVLYLGVGNVGYQSSCQLSTATLTDGNWHHLEVSRTGGVVYMFLDGQAQSVTGASNTTNYSFVSGTAISIGSQNGSNLWGSGYIDELRFQVGEGGHTASFAPLVVQYTPVSVPGIDSYTKLMLHADQTGTNFADSSAAARTVTASGDTAHSATQYRFGSAAAYFDGASDYLSVPDSADFNVEGGDFTIDGWFYVNDVSGYKSIFASQSDYVLGMFINGNRMNYFASSNGTAWDIICGDCGTVNGAGSINITANAWHHVAFVRNGNEWRGYIDGVQDIAVTSSASVVTKNENKNTGRWGNGGYWMNGYIDELRFSKGIARWTAAFTPPDAPYGDNDTSGGSGDTGQAAIARGFTVIDY